jgi:hypothetical protein
VKEKKPQVHVVLFTRDDDDVAGVDESMSAKPNAEAWSWKRVLMNHSSREVP